MKARKLCAALMVLAVCALAAGPAWANMPMLPFLGFVRLGLWWVILLALLIETVAVRYLFAMRWPAAVRAAVIVNAISLLCGFVLYPLAAMLGYALLEDMIVDLFGATDLVEKSALWIGAAVVDTVVELLALRALFAIRVDPGRAFGFLLANLASAGILVAVMAWEAHVPAMAAPEAARIEMDYAAEIAFMRDTLEAFPAHVTVTQRGATFQSPDRNWTRGILADLEPLRIRTLSLSLPPTTVWGKGSTALWKVDERFRAGDRTLEKGFFETVATVGQSPRPTGAPHYRYRIDLERDGTTYSVEAVLLNRD